MGTSVILGLSWLGVIVYGWQEYQRQTQLALSQAEQVALYLREASVIPIQNIQFHQLIHLAESAPSRLPLITQSIISLQANHLLIPPQRYAPDVVEAIEPNRDPEWIWLSCEIVAPLPQPGSNPTPPPCVAQIGDPVPSPLCRPDNPLGPPPPDWPPDLPECRPERLGRVDLAITLAPVHTTVWLNGWRWGLLLSGGIGIIYGLLHGLLDERVQRPLQQLFQAIRHVRQGEYGPSGLADHPDELGQLGQEFDQMSQTVRQRQEELERLANQDGLTHLANRRFFDHYLEQEWQRAQREQQPLSLLLCDVDYFKRYNDTYNHVAGDQCLRQVAASVQAALRRPSDLAARYGGEELAVILPNTPPEGAIHVAQRIQAILADKGIPHAGSLVNAFVTLSIGAATCVPTSERQPISLIETADQGLYRAKHQGRNQAIWQEMPPPKSEGTEGNPSEPDTEEK